MCPNIEPLIGDGLFWCLQRIEKICGDESIYGRRLSAVLDGVTRIFEPEKRGIAQILVMIIRQLHCARCCDKGSSFAFISSLKPRVEDQVTEGKMFYEIND